MRQKNRFILWQHPRRNSSDVQDGVREGWRVSVLLVSITQEGKNELQLRTGKNQRSITETERSWRRKQWHCKVVTGSVQHSGKSLKAAERKKQIARRKTSVMLENDARSQAAK